MYWFIHLVKICAKIVLLGSGHGSTKQTSEIKTFDFQTNKKQFDCPKTNHQKEETLQISFSCPRNDKSVIKLKNFSYRSKLPTYS